MANAIDRRAFAAGAASLGAGVLAGSPARAAWDDGGGERWAKILDAARGEGNVVVLGRPDLGKPFAEDFRRDTGLGLDFLGGQTRELLARFRRESAADNVHSDIILGGETVVDMIGQNLLMPLRDNLVLPGATDPKSWLNGAIAWGDNTKNFLLIGGEYVNCWPVYNSNIVKPGQLRRWTDLLDPQFAGKIAAFDPREGAGGAAASYLMEAVGVDFYRRLVREQKVVFARDGRQVVEWIARGSHWVALGAVPSDIEYFRARGMKNIVVGDMEDGAGALLGGSSVLCIAARTPRPNASIAFLNWYASKPGQDAYSRVWLTPSNRVDVSFPTIPEYTIPKPGKKYVEEYRENWWRGPRAQYEKVIEEVVGL